MVHSSNKTIAKNTLFLYFRMMFTMIVSLYTSRVILQVLGVDDFGVYQTVGGLVTLLSFVNGALSVGSSRFLTFELGTGDVEKLKRTFTTTLAIHILMAILIVVLAETVGLWFVYNKLVIASDRLDAAVFAYHLSVLTAIITITQVPYNASIISHEKMGIYAYFSIVEVSLKLLIVYMLTLTGWDKLRFYALLLCILQVGIALFYRYYCVRHFEETHFKWKYFDKNIVKEVLGYSGWNLFANTSIALNNQGTIILLNMFFSPAVVTARSIANQVNMAANQFVQNFRTAVNPQIVKRYAAEDYEGSKSLLLNSTKYSYYMMFALCLPICFVAEPLLHLWLGIVPEYAVEFLQLTIVTSLFHVFDVSFYTALYAKGQIKENAMLSPTVGFLCFPIIYLLFKIGYSPISLAWVMLVSNFIVGLIIKPILIIKIVDYRLKELMSVFMPCIVVTLASLPIPWIFYYQGMEWINNEILFNLILVFLSILNIMVAVWLLGLDENIKEKMKSFITEKLVK